MDDCIYFRPKQAALVLGVTNRTYYRIVASGLLPWTRLYAGGPRIHLPEHIAAYRAQLAAHARTGSPKAA